MNAVKDLTCFWSSLITENGIVPHIESLMSITDSEERSLALMSRVFFLWSMGLKFEREALQHKILQIQTIINKENDNCSSCAKCFNIKSLLKKQNHPERDEETHKSDDLCERNICTSKRKYLESSPKQVKMPRKENKENVDCSPKQITSFEILAPETEVFTQKACDDKEHVLLIPETIPADEFRYGNTDFFHMSQKINSDMSPEPKIRKSPRKSPIKKSPVLGKPNKASITPVQVKSKAIILHHQSPERVSKILSPEEKNVEKSSLLRTPDSLTSSPSLLACNRILSLRSPTKKDISISPCKEKSINYSSIESDSINSKLSPNNINKTPLFSHSSTLNDISVTRKLMLKTRSEVGNTIAKRSKLSRIKTLTSLQNSRPLIQVNLDSPVKKKNYKQTKITRESFSKNTNVAKLTGGKCAAVKISPVDEDEEMAKAIEESIHTKEIEDILRKKQSQLGKESPNKMKKLMGQIKMEHSLESNLRKSPRTKDQKSSNIAGPSGVPSQLTIEEVLAQLENVPESKKVEEEEEKEENTNRLRRNRKKTIMQDSFDMLPVQQEPAYAYKGDVARKKQDKKKLDGWDCHECRNYYEARGVSSPERKELQNKCSRHRSKHRPVTNTPEGFWVLGWSDDETTK